MMAPILGGPARLRYAAGKANIVFHGNSIVLGQSGASNPMPAQVQTMAPVNNQVACINKGVNGQSWAGMRSTGGQVDALFVAGIPNILIVLEGHNSQFGEGKTPAQAWADAVAYHADRLASHPEWRIYDITNIPAYYQNWSDSDSATNNAKLETYNNLARANWRSVGAKGIIETRLPGSPFVFADYNRTTFASAKINGLSIWSPNDQQGGGGTGQNQFVHPSDTGYGPFGMAGMVANQCLRRVPIR